LLANGRIGEGGSAQARQLSAFLEKQLLPLSKAALLGRIRKELNGKQHLGSGGLKSELEAVSTIARAARSGEDTFDDLIITEALDERCKRFMNQYFIDEHMKDEEGDPAARINHLLDLDEHVYGLSNKEKLANFINPILLADGNTAFFEASDGKYSERLKTLSDLQGRIMKSGLASSQVKKMAGQLDEMCLSIIEGSRLLEKVEGDAEGPHEAGQKLLEMLADGQFTVGKTSSLVREEARRYMKTPNFLEKCIDADDGLASAQKLINLKSLLVKAGMSGGQKESA
ncbi:MAG: hypothetical protein V3R73_03330, partial [Sphingomonadales bacterium]